MLSNVLIRQMQCADLGRVLHWRNDINVRQYMFSHHEISIEDHRAWFDQTSDDVRKHLLVVEVDALTIGFVSFTRLYESDVMEWSFHVDPAAIKGSGAVVCGAALDHAFNTLNAHKICGQVLDSNIRSIKLHQRLGFKEEGKLREQYCRDGRYLNVICFGMTAKEWLFEQQRSAEG